MEVLYQEMCKMKISHPTRAGLEPKTSHNSIPTHHTMSCGDSTLIITFLNPQKVRTTKIG